MKKNDNLMADRGGASGRHSGSKGAMAKAPGLAPKKPAGSLFGGAKRGATKMGKRGK